MKEMLICFVIGIIWSIGFVCGVAFRKHTQAPAAPVQTTTETYRVTAYCPCEICCGRFSDGITASGKPATGMIIAAPPEIPFGTQLYIKGWGWGEVQDRGGAIKGKRLDLLFPTHQLALNWGVKYIEVEL